MIGRLAAAAAVAGMVVTTGRGSNVPAAPAPLAPSSTAASPIVAEHRYRVLGRVRLALFWTRGDTVGSARMTSRVTPDGSELTFLLGSDPTLAPGRLNQWSYLREETAGDGAAAFALRSLSADDLEQLRVNPLPDGQLFAASCDFVHRGGIRSLLTRVDGAGATYRMFDRVLDHVARASQWEERQLPRPDGITPGLLSAMAQLMRATGVDPRALGRAASSVYVYDGTLYDLSVRGTQRLGPTEIGFRRFDRLTRVDFGIFNRRTREVTRFSASFSPDEAGPLPVQIIFQPSFWIRVELRLDDAVDVPSDPASDALMVARMHDVCSGASQRANQTAIGGRSASSLRN